LAAFALLLTSALLPTVVRSQEQPNQTTGATATSTTNQTITTATNPYKIESIPGAGFEKDFVVGPGKVELTLKPGESKTIDMFVANRTGDDRTFKMSVEDAEGSQNTEQPVVLLGDKHGPYSLKDYISIPQTTFDLTQAKQAVVPVTITIPKDAEPGGLYGSVLVQTVAVKGVPGNTGGTVPQSPIIARVGTLFFITVPGDVETSGQLKDFSTIPKQKWFQSGPIHFQVLFENTGRIHLTPYGELHIKNMLGEEVGMVQLDPWFALPGSLRLREVIWERSYLFGRYTATVQVNRGYGDKVDTMSYTFWVLPWKLIALGLVGLFLIIFLIRTLFKKFEFRRKGP
jgi:hypothetical protein